MSAELPDLTITCPRCKGEGYPAHGAAHSYSTVQAIYRHSMREVCERCHGSGALLTPAGVQVRDFLGFLQDNPDPRCED